MQVSRKRRSKVIGTCRWNEVVNVLVSQQRRRPGEVRLWGTRMDKIHRVENNWAPDGHPSRRTPLDCPLL
jgi:hypothetical protein